VIASAHTYTSAANPAMVHPDGANSAATVSLMGSVAGVIPPTGPEAGWLSRTLAVPLVSLKA
jgi:hypothetical protein